MRACRTGTGNLSNQIAVLVARKLKSLPSNPFVLVVSMLKALTSDQLEPCQTLKLKAVKMKK